MLLSFYHTCASEQHHVLRIESLQSFHFHILVGIFSLQDQMHTHLVCILSFHTLIALSAFVAWQSLLLALISIDGHLHSPFVSRFDVRLSYFLSSPYYPYHYTLFHPQCYIHGSRSCIAWWLKMLKCVKKYEPIAWLTQGQYMIYILC